VQQDLERVAANASFDWVRSAVCKVDELVEFLRRNIQKSIALDALVAELRSR
jgi:DNA polymerase-3 subunit delta'